MAKKKVKKPAKKILASVEPPVEEVIEEVKKTSNYQTRGEEQQKTIALQ